MRLESLKIRSLGPFRDFAVDLADYEGQTLIAVTGPNGAGKSTLLELGLPGALYRSTPTRGSLQDLATARDAMLEARVVNGQSWTLRHLIDPVSGKSEALVLNGAGESVLDSSKVRDFDAWAARHLPAPEVFFSSIFGAQGASGFLGAKPAERKAVLLRALGLERLEGLAARARDQVRAAERAVAELQARLEEARKAGDLDVARAMLAGAEEFRERCRKAAEAAAGLLERGRLEAADSTLAQQRWQDTEAQRTKLAAQCSALEGSLADLERRRANNAAVLADAASIRDAVAQTEAMTAQLREVDAELATARHAQELWAKELDAADREAKAAVQRLHRAEQQLVGTGAVLDTAATLPERTARAEEALRHLDQLSRALKDLEGEALVGAEGRIEQLRGGLKRIWLDDGIDDAEVAKDTLVVDDRAVRDAAEHPAKLRAARDAHAAGVTEWSTADQAKRAAEAAAARVPAIEALQAEQVASIEALAAAEDAVRAVDKRKPDAGAVAHVETKRRERLAHIERLAPLVRKAEPLAAAEGRLAELGPQIAAGLASLEAARAELGQLPTVAKPEAAPGLAKLEAEATAARIAADAAAADVGAAQARVTALEEAEARAKALLAELDAANGELADWTRLAADLGKDGLQAAEIDAAGPELTTLVNDLLHTCVGARWTVSIETMRLSADGKRQLEGCDVRVVDTEGGRDAEASTFSGGERVILGEAVSLALAMLSCRRAGLEGVTLVRDESGAALDPANARAYVQMLRRAAQLVGARHVLFVSHSPEVVDMADAKIEVAKR